MPRSCWDSVLQVASCQQLTSQRQLPAISFCCQATPRTCQRCLSCWSKMAKNSVEHSSVSTALPVERALRPWTNARLQLRCTQRCGRVRCESFHHERVLSWRRFGAEEATMPPFRAGVSQGESADVSGLCSPDRDSECGYGIAQGKTWTALGSISKP